MADADYETKYHGDGTVTYWSVYRQQWVEYAATVPDRELAAMSEQERINVLEHLRINRPYNPKTGASQS